MTDQVGDVTDLLQHLIRNACVNDGTPASGQEARNADLLTAYLGTSGLDVERFEARPGGPTSWPGSRGATRRLPR